MVLRFIGRYRFIGICGIFCFALDACTGMASNPGHPVNPTGQYGNQYRFSQPGKDRHDFYVSRLDCLRSGNERFMTSCLATMGWRLDPDGFQSPTKPGN